MKRKVIVVKYGSSSVATQEGMDSERLKRYAIELTKVYDQYDIIIVSSGSVAAGRHLWFQKLKKQNAADNRTLAMLGSAPAFKAWQDALLKHDIASAQLLVTHHEVEDVAEGPNLLLALEINLQHRIITIVNENDALSDTELAKLSYGGDNDGLAAHIAVVTKASALFLLTDQIGLLSDGKLIKNVLASEQEWMAAKNCTQATTNKTGRGGMLSKVEAAIQASRAGVGVRIASSGQPLSEVLVGKHGTFFAAKS